VLAQDGEPRPRLNHGDNKQGEAMSETEILGIIRTAPPLAEGRWSAIVERAANSLLTVAHRLPDAELEALIGLVALCYQKAGAENCASDEYAALMKRLANSTSLRR
jgi:hypothetical protein